MVVTDYNEQFLDKRGTDHLIDELKAYIDSISTGSVDLSDYVTKSELQAKLDALNINIDLSSYATKEELTNAINSIDLSAYALKTEIPSLNGYVTEEQLNAKGYLTEHQDLSAYALKTEIPSLDGYATTEYVDNVIANVPSGGNSGTSSTGSNDFSLNTEVVIGTYMNKPLYRKMIELSEITVGTHTIAKSTFTSENIDIVKIGGQFINVYSEKMNLPFFESTSSYASAYLTDYNTNIKIISKVSSAHGSAWAYGYLYIEYTKTRDKM